MTRNPQPRPSNPLFVLAALFLLIGALLTALPTLGDPHGDEATKGWPSPAGWPEYGGNHHRAGASPTTGPTSNTHATSAYSLNDRSFSSPVMDHEGDLYGGDISGRVTKLSPELEKIWTSAPLGGELRSSVLVAPDGNVYVAPAANEEENAKKDGDLFALDAETGDVQWRYSVANLAEDRGKYVLTAAPAYHPDGFILQGSMDGHLYALTLDGELLWRFKTHDDMDNKVVSTPAIAKDGTIYFGSQNGRLYALGPDGESRWDYEATEEASGAEDDVEQIVAAPSIGSDDTVYFATRHAGEQVGVVYALDDQGESVQKKWSRVLDEKIVAPVTVRGDAALFVGALDGTFYRLDGADGSIEWTFNAVEDDPGLDNVIPGLIGNLGGTALLTIAEQALVADNQRVYVSYWNVDITQGFPPEHSDDSPFYSLNAKNGSIDWRRTYENTKRAPAMMPTTTKDDNGNPRGVLYLAGDDGEVHAIGGIAPDPVRLAAPSLPEDQPEGEPEDGNRTKTPDPQDTHTPQETATQTDNNTDDGNEGLFNELPAPAVGLILALLMTALGVRRRRRA